MYIPKKLKVRIQKSQNENPLAYITYLDEKNKLRKGKSWINWGNAYLGEFDNVPKSGFKIENIEKRSRDWFGTGRTMFRILHPDNFIFEISSNNILEICLETDLTKGIISQDCVLAWEGSELALIPTNTQQYKSVAELSETVDSGNVKPGNLIVGKTYRNRNGSKFQYLGKFLYIKNSDKIVKERKYSYGYIGGTSTVDKGIKNYKISFGYYHCFKYGDKQVSLIEKSESPKMFESEKQFQFNMTESDIRNLLSNEDVRYRDYKFVDGMNITDEFINEYLESKKEKSSYNDGEIIIDKSKLKGKK